MYVYVLYLCWCMCNACSARAHHVLCRAISLPPVYWVLSWIKSLLNRLYSANMLLLLFYLVSLMFHPFPRTNYYYDSGRTLCLSEWLARCGSWSRRCRLHRRRCSHHHHHHHRCSCYAKHEINMKTLLVCAVASVSFNAVVIRSWILFLSFVCSFFHFAWPFLFTLHASVI